MQCSVCGNKVRDGVNICPVCGNDLINNSSNNQRENTGFLTQRTSVLGLGIIALFILFIISILKLVEYSNFIGSGIRSFNTYGIVGLIFGIFIILANLGLISLSIVNLLKHQLEIDKKFLIKLTQLGLGLVLLIAVFTFIMALYESIVFSNASWFFEPFFVNYGFLAIFVFSFLIIEKEIVYKDKNKESDKENWFFFNKDKMRIIGGKNRSRIINEVGIPTTKPTADNVREAVFNSLYDVNGAVVLDLFAGSGSYGLEALSRGAKSSHFNDNHPKAIATIKENINLLGEKENSFVTPYEYNQALFHIRNKDLK